MNKVEVLRTRDAVITTYCTVYDDNDRVYCNVSGTSSFSY